MKKWTRALLLTAAMTLAFSAPAFAGEWQKDGQGWWYREDDGSYPAGGWYWIDGDHDGTAECYYFTDSGYMAENLGKIEGYTIDNNGAWTVDGVVQTKDVTEPNDPEAFALLTKLVQENENLDAFDADVKMTMTINASGETGTMEMNVNMKEKGAYGDDFEYVMDGTMSVDGEVTPILTFYKDGYTYTDMMGLKIKQKTTVDEAMRQSANLEAGAAELSAVNGLKMREEGGKKILTYNMNGAKMNATLNESSGALAEMMGLGMDYKIKNAHGEYTVDANNKLVGEKAYIEMDMTMEVPDEDPVTIGYVMDVEIAINKTGKSVKVSLPSTDGYEELSEEGL